MQCINKYIVVLMIYIAGLQFTACHEHQNSHQIEHPAKVAPIDGSDLKRVTLTEKAMERIDLKTALVREEYIAASRPQLKLVAPYSALIYDPNGQTWIYVSPEPRTFVRHKVIVDYIIGEKMILKEGPPPGTEIAVVGVAELYGTEFGIGH